MSRTFFKNFLVRSDDPELATPAGVWYQSGTLQGVGLNEERENEERGFETRKRPPKVNPVADKEAKNTKWGFAAIYSPWTAGPAFSHTDILAVLLLSQRGSVSRTIFHQLPPELWPGLGRYGVRCLVNENEGTRKRGWGRGIHATGHSVKFQ